MGEYTPNFLPGQAVTYIAASAIAVPLGGGSLVLEVKATGRSVGPTTAASDHCVGVPLFDAASGSRVTVSRGGEQKLIASGAITAGTPVKSAAGGKIAAWVTGTDNPSLILGKALTTTAADGDLCDVTWTA